MATNLSVEERLEALTLFADNVIREARIELSAKQPRKSYRAQWKGGQLVGYQVTTKRYASDNTGALASSLRYEIKEISGNYIVVFSAADYWYYVNFGRKAGKYAPVSVIEEWVRSKPIRPQLGGGKGFAKVTPQTLKSLSFLINRKIKTFGIEGTRFWTKTVEYNTKELQANIGKRMAKDIINTISKWPFS
jgi:hypothetical protein